MGIKMYDKAKPTVTCELISLEQIGDAYRAVLRRTSSHPKLGPERSPSVRTVTSRIVRIDWDTRIIETLNTYYEF